MAKAKSKKKRNIILGILAALVLILIVVVVTGSNKEELIYVQTEKAVKRNITEIVTATGKINPEYQVVITPEVTGEIVELPVEEGDKVSKGDLLIRIKPDIYIAQKNRADATLEAAKATLSVRKATLDQVEAEYTRVQGLFAKGLASDSELDQAKSVFLQNKGQYESQVASVTQANESLKEAQEQLAKTAIYAPLTGTVSALNVEIGERVLGSGFAQGTNLMTVADLSLMEATVEVDENDVVRVEVGDTAKIEIDAFKDVPFLGTVTQIGNSAITSGLGTQNEVVNFEVKIKLHLGADQNLVRPGMSCDADIQTETKKNVIAVPIQSVTARMENPGEIKEGDNVKVEIHKKRKPQEVVFLLENGIAKKTDVKTGISDDTYIEVTEGLTGNEEVISGPYKAVSQDISDGKKVYVEEKNKEKSGDKS